MKKVSRIYIYICLIMTAIIPIIGVKAEILNYSDGVRQANNYILNNKFEDKNKYIVFNVPYEYNENGNSLNTLFNSGGMISKREYEISVRENKSYLSPGIEYWTLTNSKEDISKQYYIDTGIKEKLAVEKSGVRVTEYVKPEVRVKGEGKYNSPWEFYGTYVNGTIKM